jgi:hypothetical protein
MAKIGLSPATRAQIGRNVAALAIGGLVWVVLVVSCAFIGALLVRAADTQPGSLFSWENISFAIEDIRFLLGGVWLAGVCLAIICTPIWMLLDRLKLAGWISAALLGFTATVFLLLLLYPVWAYPAILKFGFIYALCTAVAGLVTWWASPARRASVIQTSGQTEVTQAGRDA